jgi:DNA mismatch repair protein MutS
MTTDTLTPMMQQYRRIRSELPPEVILFFRLGDFYEMFFEDAREAAPILDVTLTRRNGVPMCGVPYHAVEGYLARLIRAGRKVAICDQMEDPATVKGIVKREVTRVITPGTVIEDQILESGRNNFLAGISRSGSVFGLALLDISTGLFFGEEPASPEALRASLAAFAPAECAVPEGLKADPDLREVLHSIPGMQVSSCDDWIFAADTARDTLVRHFKVHSLAGFGCEGRTAVVGAAGGILYYVRDQLRRQVTHVGTFQLRQATDFVLVDEATCNNLDLVPAHSKNPALTLQGVLDVTCTPMGRRKLHDWVLYPLAQLEPIIRRQDAVEALCKDRALLRDLRETLSPVRDLERLIARIGAGSGNGRDLAALGVSLSCVPAVRALLAEHPAPLLRDLAAQVSPLPELVDLIGRAIVEEPPIVVREGGLIRPGYNAQLDELRSAATDGRQWLAEYQAREQERTGIKTLKVRHNKVFGYYIEISRGQLANVPPDYIRKQTVATGERYITPELKEYENRIVGAEEKSVALEYEIFLEVRDAAARETAVIQKTADAVAQIDVLASLADRALALRYVRPAVTAGDAIRIRDGRHAVIEQMPGAERFVPNDTLLDNLVNQLIIITGPNMAGKSTYIRQVALIVIMAQIGSFVPALEAEIGIVDRVFTRVGASDDLARGRSTFLVEMQETANILNNATTRSLIVLDEIGRGTSTFDGISIAWAVAEHLHNSPHVKAKTLFATHYHELTELQLTMPGVKNYNVLVREQGDHIVFLRKIVPGGADKSYGIHVARLAGMPQEVVDRAREVLANLEEGELAEGGQPAIAKKRIRRERGGVGQMQLFG